MEIKPVPKSTSTLSRRNTINIPLVPENEVLPTTKLLPHHTSFPNTIADAGAASSSSGSSSSLTSMKDLLALSPVKIPKLKSYDDIGNGRPSVKQAAWYYVQPRFPRPDTDSGNIFERLWMKTSAMLSRSPVIRAIRRALGCLFM